MSETFLIELERRCANAKADARKILEASRRAGRTTLTNAEDREFRRLTADIESLNERIEEQRTEERARGLGSDTLARLREAQGVGTRAYRSAATKARADALAPLTFDQGELRAAFKTLESGGTAVLTTRNTFSSPDSQLPAQLFPEVLGPQHEQRILSKLPAFAMQTEALTYIQISSVQGAATQVAEGALIPELSFATQPMTAHAIKLGCHGAVSNEIIDDWEEFYSWVQRELMRQIIDVENNQLLNSTTGIVGFLGTSGILTHDASTDTGTNVTAIDSIEKSLATLRTSSALAEGNLMVTHPSTWSAIRRLKDTVGRFLLYSNDDNPSNVQTETIYGMDVVSTIACPAGTAVLLDTRKFGRALVRKPIEIRIAWDGNDLTHGLLRSVVTERLALAVEYPAAVLALTGLPTS